MLDQAQQDFEDAKKWAVLSKVHNDPRLKLGDRRTALYLLLPADDKGDAQVTIMRLAELTEQDQTAVQRSIRKLESLGYFDAYIGPATAASVGASLH